MRSQQRRWVVVALLIGVVLALGLFLVFNGEEEDGPPSGGPGAGSTSETQATDEVAVTSDAVEETAEPTVVSGVAPTRDPGQITADAPDPDLVEPFLDSLASALVEPENLDRDELVTVASGAALGAVDAQATEYALNGWTQVGSPEVLETRVASIDPDIDIPTADVDICLDYSQVDVVDSQGDSILDPAASTRVAQTVTLEFTKGRWVATDRTFPDDFQC